jgi:glycosyltransferase involved in cell wall biosynthesis
LVNTSQYEGFPNTFVQAWRQYTPTITLDVDPDEVIHKYGLGLCSGSMTNMICDVKKLLGDNDFRRQMGENAWQYFKNNHDIGKVVKDYIEVFGSCDLEI